MESQNMTILNHLKAYRSITTIEAFEKYGITRLSARIFELKEQDIKIITSKKKVMNRYGKYTYVAVYKLV